MRCRKDHGIAFFCTMREGTSDLCTAILYGFGQVYVAYAADWVHSSLPCVPRQALLVDVSYSNNVIIRST